MEPAKFTDKEGIYYRMLRGIKRKIRNSRLVKRIRQKQQDARWAKLPKASLLSEISIEKYNPSEIFLIGNENNGKDFLLLKTNGIFGSELYKTEKFTNKFSFLDSALFSLTRIDQGGNHIWSFPSEPDGDSDSKKVYCCHASEELLKIADINNDGTDEIIVINNNKLIILDSTTGRIINKTELPLDNFGVVQIIEDRNKNEKRIIVSVMADAYDEYMYANPTLLFDSDLKLLKKIEATGSGHRIIPVDFNKDNVEEFIDGYEMFDFEGNRIWRLDEFEKREYRPLTDHVDHMEIVLSGDKIYGAIAGSDYFYWIDVVSGKTIWKKKPIHAQYCLVGKFIPECKPLIFLTNMTHKVQFMDFLGEIVWEGPLPPNWPLGKPANLSDRMFHMGIPANKIIVNGEEYVLYNEMGWPYCVTGMGTPGFTFPNTSNIKKPVSPLPDHRGDDFGMGFYTRVVDVNNDKKDEVVIFDRRYIWVYSL